LDLALHLRLVDLAAEVVVAALVERHREWAVLAAWFVSAAADQLRVLLIAVHRERVRRRPLVVERERHGAGARQLHLVGREREVLGDDRGLLALGAGRLGRRAGSGGRGRWPG